jgi:hypothetical protein
MAETTIVMASNAAAVNVSSKVSPSFAYNNYCSSGFFILRLLSHDDSDLEKLIL